MKHTEFKTGAYRQLFLDALALYRESASPEEYAVIDHYAKLLNDPSYKFGVPAQGGGGYADFFRS